MQRFNLKFFTYGVLVYLAFTTHAFGLDAVDIAALQIGKPYAAATGPDSFDCSGLMQYSYGQLGITLPRSSTEQSQQVGTLVGGTELGTVPLQRGDLLFFDMEKPTRPGGPVVNHVGIFQGDGVMISAMSEQLGINLGHLDRQFWKERFMFARRVTVTTPTATLIDDVGGQDIWTTSVFSFSGLGGGPGGGLNNDQLVVGGWGDEYRSLIRFDIRGLPKSVSFAKIRLYVIGTNAGSNGTVAMYLDQATSSWDWTTQPTSALAPDNSRLWWANSPKFAFFGPLPTPTVGSYYDIYITSIYNQWQSGAIENFGVQLRPTDTNNFWNVFASSNNSDPAWRPQLIITP